MASSWAGSACLVGTCTSLLVAVTAVVWGHKKPRAAVPLELTRSSETLARWTSSGHRPSWTPRRLWHRQRRGHGGRVPGSHGAGPHRDVQAHVRPPQPQPRCLRPPQPQPRCLLPPQAQPRCLLPPHRRGRDGPHVHKHRHYAQARPCMSQARLRRRRPCVKGPGGAGVPFQLQAARLRPRRPPGLVGWVWSRLWCRATCITTHNETSCMACTTAGEKE